MRASLEQKITFPAFVLPHALPNVVPVALALERGDVVALEVFTDQIEVNITALFELVQRRRQLLRLLQNLVQDIKEVLFLLS